MHQPSVTLAHWLRYMDCQMVCAIAVNCLILLTMELLPEMRDMLPYWVPRC